MNSNYTAAIKLKQIITMCILLFVATNTHAQHKKIASKPLQQVYDVNGIYIHPKPISTALIAPHALHLTKPFNPVKALQALIPGNFATFPRLEDSADLLNITAWTCNNCKTYTLQDWENPITFPFDANITELADTIHFSNAHGNHILLTFATHDALNCTCIFCSRFTGVVLGVALFTEHHNVWELRAFNYGLGCYGAFQKLPAIQMAELDNCEFYLLNSNGAAGGVYYSALYMFALANGTFKKVLNIPAVRRYNTGLSNWDMGLKNAKPAPGQKFSPIEVTLQGTFLKDTLNMEFGSADIPPGLARYTPKNDSFDFTVSYLYKFSNGAYHKTSTNAVIKK